MVTLDDVAGIVKAQLAAQSGYNTTLPGGSWFDRGPDTPAGYPYDVFKIEAGLSELTSGGAYVQRFTVRVAGYCPLGDSGVNVQLVSQLFHAALVSVAAQTALLAASLRNASEKVLAGVPSSARGEYAPTLRDGKDVWIAGLTVDLIVQGDRGAA